MATIKLQNQIITSLSGSLGHCASVMACKPFGITVPGQTARDAQTKILRRKARRSMMYGQRRRKRPKKIRYHDQAFCACDAYLVADWLWCKGMIDKQLWRRAVKKSHMTGYDLWIMEACALAKQGFYLPDVPSVSGGYTTWRAVAGSRWQPPADCVQAPKKVYLYLSKYYSDPLYRNLKTVAYWGHDPDWKRPPETILEVEFRWYWDPWDGDEYISCRKEWDGASTAITLTNPFWPYFTRMQFEQIFTNVSGAQITYQHHDQGDGFLKDIWSSPRGFFQAAGPWA